MKLIIITIAILIISGLTLATFRNYIDEVNVSRESDASELGGLREYVGSRLNKLSELVVAKSDMIYNTQKRNAISRHGAIIMSVDQLDAKSDMIYNNIPIRKNAISRHGTIMERVDELGDKIDNVYALQKAQVIKNGGGFKALDAKIDNVYALQKAQVIKNGGGFKALDAKINNVYALQKAQAIKNGGGASVPKPAPVPKPVPLATGMWHPSRTMRGFPRTTDWNIHQWKGDNFNGRPEGDVRQLCSNNCRNHNYAFYTLNFFNAAAARAGQPTGDNGCGCSTPRDQMQTWLSTDSKTMVTRRVGDVKIL